MLAFRTCQWGVLLGLLLLSLAGQAQVSPVEKAQFQRRLRAMWAGHQSWDNSPDSLYRVLAGQHLDSLRLQTLEHLASINGTTTAEDQEMLALANRLHYPERAVLRLLAASDQINPAKPGGQQQLLDTLRRAVQQYDSLGPVPIPTLLYIIRNCYLALKQPAAERAYFQRQLAYYQQHGPVVNVAMCCRLLGRHYEEQGDYNQAINYRLRAAELYRTFSPFWYYNEVAVIGACYVDWGNSVRGLPYLQEALARPKINANNWVFVNYTIAVSYLQQGRYPLVFRYVRRALRPRRPGEQVDRQNLPHLLVLQGAALLGVGRAGEARPWLQRAQHLVDSLHLPLRTSLGYCELQATWARYYAATGDYPRAEAAWRAAYDQARQEHLTPLRLAYLQKLAQFYQQRARPAVAAPYALAALALADTLSTSQAATYVAQYELVQADRAQAARLAKSRRQQRQATAQAQRQQRALLYTGAGVVGLLLLAGVLYAAFRRSRRLAQLVTAQKQDLQQQRDQLEHQRDQLDTSLTELRTTQQQLIQKEKMASLGELTAGIAHEIQNPLNFVNNFADVSTELVGELRQELTKGDLTEAYALADDLEQNLTKIHQHGQRASGIVRGMLEHSRTSTGERQATNLNALCEEYLRLAYHGLRAKDPSFNAELLTTLAPSLPLVEVIPGDLGRVLLNLLTNAFYAVQQRQRTGEADYVPTVSLRTRQVGEQIEIQVQDNGTGMSAEVQAKVFQPFFTTKPAGEGTGLGLSLSYDIITQGHGGSLTVESQPGQGSTFTISLPVLVEGQ